MADTLLNLNIRPYGRVPVFPVITRPQPVGVYSVNALREFIDSAENVHYYVEPAESDYPLDLDAGIERVVEKPRHAKDERIDHILKFIRAHKSKLIVTSESKSSHNSTTSLNADFVCFRGVLRLIMCTPYERCNDWLLHVSKVKGTIYINQVETPQQAAENARMTDRNKRMQHWGFKFEQYCMSTKPNTLPDTSQPVNESTELGCVFKTRLAGLQLLYAAEIDGVLSAETVDLTDPLQLSNVKFIELKTRPKFMNKGQYRRYLHHKTCAWWCQSFLVGIEDVHVGLRDDYGKVHNIEIIPLRTLCKPPNCEWSSSNCANFLNSFLKNVQSVMANIDTPQTVIEFEFTAATSRIRYRTIKDTTRSAFVPSWYQALF